jgi:hypothetical protein
MNKILKGIGFIFSLVLLAFNGYSKPTNNGIFQIHVYHLKNNEQVKATDDFLQTALLPALHRFGIKNIGVFKPIANDTANDKLICVLIPYSSIDQWVKINDRLNARMHLINLQANNFYMRIQKILRL